MKFCNKCGAPRTGDAKFCGKCGKSFKLAERNKHDGIEVVRDKKQDPRDEIEVVREHPVHPRKRKPASRIRSEVSTDQRKKIHPFFVIILIVGGVIALFMFTGQMGRWDSGASQSSSPSSTSYQKSCHYEQVPYEEQEAYQKTLNYNVFDVHAKETLSGFDYSMIGSYMLQNLDTQDGGYFTAYLKFTQGSNEGTEQQRVYLNPGQVQKLEFLWKGSTVFGGLQVRTQASITPPTVTKYRTVIKHRQQQVCE